MNLAARAVARWRWVLASARHTRADRSLIASAQRLDPDLGAAVDAAAERWTRAEPEWAGRFVAWATARLRSARPSGPRLEPHFLEPRGWHVDWRTGRVWPLVPHARIRLDDPRRPGDVRLQWEPARLAHEIVIAHDGAREKLDRARRSFDEGNPLGLGIHWAVGMEIALRLAARLLSLDAEKDRSGAERGRSAIGRLAQWALYLRGHVERNPRGFTTNHTLADHAGLALAGACLPGSARTREWSEAARAGLAECLGEQVLVSGAHAEGSLAYARFAAETAFVAAAALELPASDPSVRALTRLTSFLERSALPSGLPHVGDCDESFFPPFGLTRWRERDPFDPSPVIAAVREWWPGGHPSDDAAGATDAGFLRFGDGRLEGGLVSRTRGQGWLPTHAHDDLLSICLDLDGEPLVIDPGTGGYAIDRPLRHLLRRIDAHSTLQVERQEPWRFEPRVLFEGPGEIAGGARVSRGTPTQRIIAWHDGFEGLRVTRTVSSRAGALWVEDRVEALPGSRAPRGHAPVESTVRFVLATGLQTSVKPDRGVEVLRSGLGVARFLLLRPARADWQIRRAPRSRRYAQSEEGPVLEASMRGPLPHRWLTRICPLQESPE